MSILLANKSADDDIFLLRAARLASEVSFPAGELLVRLVAILTSTLLPTVALNIESNPLMSLPVLTTDQKGEQK